MSNGFGVGLQERRSFIDSGSETLLCAIDNHRERRDTVVAIGHRNMGSAIIKPMQAIVHLHFAETDPRSKRSATGKRAADAQKPMHSNDGSDPYTEAVRRPFESAFRKKSGRACRAIGAGESDPTETSSLIASEAGRCIFTMLGSPGRPWMR